MTLAAKRRVSITGNGSASGGVYQSIRITGDAQVDGNTESETFSCTGTCIVNGSMGVRIMRIMGETAIGGDLKATQLSLMGQLNVSGNARGGTLKVRGHIDVAGECEADYFHGRGGFHIQGLLAADRVEIGMFGPCHAKEIGGSSISIRKSKWMGIKKIFARQGEIGLMTETIEGDRIYVEYTKADVIRGNSITIGPGCDIGHVDYRTSLVKHKSSVVRGETKK